MKRLKKFKVGFWMSNGNRYMFYIKALDYNEAVSIAYEDKLSNYEPVADINEIMVHCITKEV